MVSGRPDIGLSETISSIGMGLSGKGDGKMITEERVVTYIRSLETEECPMLEEIEREALEEGVPIIRKETQSFLKTASIVYLWLSWNSLCRSGWP